MKSGGGGYRPVALSDLVESLRRDEALGSVVRGSKLLERWEEIVGERFAGKVQPVEVHRGVLTVLVPNSAWAHEFMCCCGNIRSRIARLTGVRVERIRCKQSSDGA